MKTCLLTVGLLLAAACSATAQPTWTLYRPTNTGIPGNFTQTIYIDEQDRPYIAAYLPFWEEGGMAIQDAQDPHRWTTISSVNYPTITSPRFNDIERAPDGTLWIASDGGLLHYDPAVGPSSLVRYDAANSPMPTSQVLDVAVEPVSPGAQAAVWLAIFDVSLGHGGLARFDPATNTWRVWPRPDPIGPAYTKHVAIIPDATGTDFSVWFSPAFQGLGVYRNGALGPAPTSGGVIPNRFPSPRAVDNLGNAESRTPTATKVAH